MERGSLDIDEFRLIFDRVFVIATDIGSGNMYAKGEANISHVKSALIDALNVVTVEAVSAFFENTEEHTALGDYLMFAFEIAAQHVKNAKQAAASGITYDEFNES